MNVLISLTILGVLITIAAVIRSNLFGDGLFVKRFL